MAISVLIVEDVDEMRLLLEEAVRGAPGLKLSGSVASVAEAHLELSRRRPDLVLLDEVLPGESSADLLEFLVEDRVPVLLMTSMEVPEHSVPPGAAGRISKPGWRTLKEDQARLAAEIQAAIRSSHKPG